MQKRSGRLELEDYKLLKDDADDVMLYNDLHRLRLYQGDDVNVEPGWEQKAFTVPDIHRAAFTGNIAQLSTLAKCEKNVNLPIKDGPKILQYIYKFERNYVGFFVGTTPLMIASERGNTKAVRILLQNGAVVNTADSIGLTALSWACASNRKSTCEFLLSNRALIDLRDDRYGMSSLILACRQNATNMAKWLIESRANIHSRDSKGRSALHFAAWNYNIPLMTCLVDNGAQLNTKDRLGMTPLHLLTSEECVHEPVELEQEMSELEQSSIALLLEQNSQLYQKGVRVILDINRSITRGSDSVPSTEEYFALEKLIRLGANVNVQDKAGNTPLHILASRLPKAVVAHGFVICTAPKTNQSLLVQMLILQRFDVNIDRANLEGHTAADLCAQGANWIGVDMLRRFSESMNDEMPRQQKLGREIWRTGMQYCEKEKDLEMAIEKMTDSILYNSGMTPRQTWLVDFKASTLRLAHDFVTDTLPNGLRAWFL